MRTGVDRVNIERRKALERGINDAKNQLKPTVGASPPRAKRAKDFLYEVNPNETLTYLP